MSDLRTEVAYLLWCMKEGYLKSEDRAILTNWMYLPDDQLHPDDAEKRAGLLEMADDFLAGWRDLSSSDETARATAAEGQMADIEHYKKVYADVPGDPCVIEGCRLSQQEHHRLAYGWPGRTAGVKPSTRRGGLSAASGTRIESLGDGRLAAQRHRGHAWRQQ